MITPHEQILKPSLTQSRTFNICSSFWTTNSGWLGVKQLLYMEGV